MVSSASLAAWFSFWFAATIVFNGAAVALVDAAKLTGLDPEDVTLLEMMACGILGLLVESRRGLGGLIPTRGYRGPMLVLSVANLATCRLFIIAMQHIPLSLLQTVRACQPLFAVVSLRLLAGERYSSAIYSSVATISTGFAASASGDAHFDAFGFACGCASVTLLVFVNFKTKRLLQGSAGEVDSAQVQGWTTLGSFLLLLPLWAVRGGGQRLATGFLHDQGGALARALALDGVTYYLANVGTFRSITMLDPLSFSVLDTVRRLCVVASGFVFQGNPCSAINVAGIALVFVGAAAYARATAQVSATKEKAG